MGSDISDLDHGVIPDSLRWSSTNGGTLGYTTFDYTTGERTVTEIELGSRQARFVLDMHTRERGFGMTRKGVYDMKLAPVGVTPPPWPGEGYKPAVGCWVWSPILGEFRLETCSSMFRTAILALWGRLKTFADIDEGCPVIHFVDRYCHEYEMGTYWGPIIDLNGFYPRAKIPCFAAHMPTVVAPATLDAVHHFASLEAPAPFTEQESTRTPPRRAKVQRTPQHTSTAKPDQDGLADYLDDDLPENLK